MDQIDSSSRNMTSDEEKLIMKDKATEFMNLGENQKKIKDMIGRGQRFNVSVDEVRAFSPKLS